jgi:hypothetical protein
MGHEILFEDLPKACRRLALDASRSLWGPQDAEGAA